MAAKSTKLSSSLVLKYMDGVDAKGKEIIKSLRFAKVKTMATEQDIFDVAMEMEKLLGKTLDEIVREDQSGITSV